MAERVLVADDGPAVRRLFEAILSKAGYEVSTAEDGIAALEKLRANPPDVLVTDWNMPGVTGIELCETMRRIGTSRRVHVILVTGNDKREEVVAGLKAGADDYVTKPVHREELLARVAAGVRGIKAATLEDERDRLRGAVTAIEQVIGVLGHELRTPLGTLRVTLGLLKEQASSLPLDCMASIEVAHDQAERAAKLVNDVLELARIESGSRVWAKDDVDLAKLVTREIERIEPAAHAVGSSLVARHAPDTIRAEADRGAIGAAITALLENAVRHAPGSMVQVRLDANEEETAIVVTDDGPGIAPEILGRIGSPFAVSNGLAGTDGAAFVGGRGSGLYLCRRIAQAHGGGLTVESAPGEGTIATLRLATRKATAKAA